MELSAPKVEVSGFGNVIKAADAVKEPVDILDIAPVVSHKPEFDPNTVANALVSEEKEGGVFKATSTGPTGLDTKRKTSIGFNQPEQQDKWELFGCYVRYTVPGTTTDIASEQVRLFFDTKEEAIQAVEEIEGGKATTNTVVKYKNLVGSVSLGHPCIAYDDILKFEYVDRKWRRS